MPVFFFYTIWYPNKQLLTLFTPKFSNKLSYYPSYLTKNSAKLQQTAHSRQNSINSKLRAYPNSEILHEQRSCHSWHFPRLLLGNFLWMNEYNIIGNITIYLFASYRILFWFDCVFCPTITKSHTETTKPLKSELIKYPNTKMPFFPCIFTTSSPLGRVGHKVAMSVCLSVCVSAPSSAFFFLGLSLAFRLV